MRILLLVTAILFAFPALAKGNESMPWAHNDDEIDQFAKIGVKFAVSAPREIGRRMIEYLNRLLSQPFRY